MNNLSNYPPGFTQADHDALVNGEAGLIECGTCRIECDPNEETITELDGEPQCGACRESCEGCGDWLTDETVALLGPVVHYRDYVYNGRLTPAHAQCAADILMVYLDKSFDYDHSTREEIAAMVQVCEVCR